MKVSTLSAYAAQNLPILLIVAWVLTMIAIPIQRWTVGDVALRWGVLVTTGLLVLAFRKRKKN